MLYRPSMGVTSVPHEPTFGFCVTGNDQGRFSRRRNDGRWLPPQRIEVVTLTEQGLRLAYETGKFTPEQKLYHGLVKPREAEHDTQIYRAYLKEAEQIERAGGKNLRVELDFELKRTSTKKCTLLGNLSLSAMSPRSSRKWPNASICHISITKLKFQTLAFITSLTRTAGGLLRHRSRNRRLSSKTSPCQTGGRIPRLRLFFRPGEHVRPD